MIIMCVCMLNCVNFCGPMDCNPPGSSVHRIFQARILEWLSLPTPGNRPYQGMEPASLMFPVLAGRFFTTSTTWEVPMIII